MFGSTWRNCNRLPIFPLQNANIGRTSKNTDNIFPHIPDSIICSRSPTMAENWHSTSGLSMIYRLQQQSIRRLAFVPPYSVFCSISFRCGGLSIERNQKPLAPKITLAATHHDRQKQVEVKRSSRVNPHEIRLFSGCPYAVVK